LEELKRFAKRSIVNTAETRDELMAVVANTQDSQIALRKLGARRHKSHPSSAQRGEKRPSSEGVGVGPNEKLRHEGVERTSPELVVANQSRSLPPHIEHSPRTEPAHSLEPIAHQDLAGLADPTNTTAVDPVPYVEHSGPVESIIPLEPVEHEEPATTMAAGSKLVEEARVGLPSEDEEVAALRSTIAFPANWTDEYCDACWNSLIAKRQPSDVMAALEESFKLSKKTKLRTGKCLLSYKRHGTYITDLPGTTREHCRVRRETEGQCVYLKGHLAWTLSRK
jgi:hypothetical protein